MNDLLESFWFPICAVLLPFWSLAAYAVLCDRQHRKREKRHWKDD